MSLYDLNSSHELSERTGWQISCGESYKLPDKLRSTASLMQRQNEKKNYVGSETLDVGSSFQEVVHNVRDEMAESVMPLRKGIIDNLTRQGMHSALH